MLSKTARGAVRHEERLDDHGGMFGDEVSTVQHYAQPAYIAANIPFPIMLKHLYESAWVDQRDAGALVRRDTAGRDNR